MLQLIFRTRVLVQTLVLILEKYGTLKIQSNSIKLLVVHRKKAL